MEKDEIKSSLYNFYILLENPIDKVDDTFVDLLYERVKDMEPSAARFYITCHPVMFKDGVPYDVEGPFKLKK